MKVIPLPSYDEATNEVIVTRATLMECRGIRLSPSKYIEWQIRGEEDD
ncbi:241_t:CDS:2 [Ambispora gerdemannii]|uniref:241_t:CDS:1 n=1 Tax=Ambispora gerdemannii TaxID=144530 RepID=A0A9N8ZZ65_9GLOM|nr:241_t:CDS:2 [Ambispora gerdemannii]